MAARLYKRLDSLGLLEDCTYGDAIHRLERFKMIRAEDGGWSVNRTALTDAKFAARTGIMVKPVVPKEVKKRGRPKGSKDTHPRKRRKSDDGAEASLS